MGLSTKNPRKRQKIKRRGHFFVYILQCVDGSFYTGYTNDLDKRIALHNSGRGSKYVRTRLPVKLIFFKSYRYFKLAVLEERRIKTLTRRQKENLILKHHPKRSSPKKIRLKAKRSNITD